MKLDEGSAHAVSEALRPKFRYVQNFNNNAK